MEITIENRIARVNGSPEIICGNSDYTIAFQFDAEWAEYARKTAQFRYLRNGIFVTETAEFFGSYCAVPVLHEIDFVEIGVTAGDIRTAAPARVPCVRCITDIPAEAYSPPDDVYNALMETLAEKLNHLPALPDGCAFIVTEEGDYVLTGEGDYLIAEG